MIEGLESPAQLGGALLAGANLCELPGTTYMGSKKVCRTSSIVRSLVGAMPRYFFHVHDGQSFSDEDGVELGGIDEARDQAVVAAGEALRDKGGKFWKGGEWFMRVVDENGETVCRLRFSAE